jgi:tetratricopeptide (TPR) repeat protein
MRPPLDSVTPKRPGRRAEPTDPLARSFELRRRGDFAGAARELRRAEALDPSDTTIALNFASCLIRTREPQAARERFLKVLAAEPDHAEARYGLGVALTLLGDNAAARREFQRAVELSPAHAPALGALAFALHRDGESAEARALAERAIALSPGLVDAAMVLAKLDAADGEHGAVERRARALIARPEIGAKNRATALLLLGDALDGQGDYDRAFEAYQTGKAEFGRLYARAFDGDRSARALAERAYERLASAPPSPAWTPRGTPLAGAPRQHVFLMGFARSGTTLLEQVLGAHPDVVDLDEQPTLADTQRDFLEASDGPERLQRLDDADRTARRETYWASVRSFGVEPEAKVFVDKQPLAGLMLPAISVLFPEAKVLFAVRDPRDVVLSCFRRGFEMNPAMYEFTGLERAARFYDAAMRFSALARERSALGVHEVRYERLVADFEAETRAVCGFLGLDWSEETGRFAEHARARRIRTPSAAQVTRGLYAGGAGQWRNYRQAMQPVLPILAPWVARWGYATE